MPSCEVLCSDVPCSVLLCCTLSCCVTLCSQCYLKIFSSVQCCVAPCNAVFCSVLQYSTISVPFAVSLCAMSFCEVLCKAVWICTLLFSAALCCSALCCAVQYSVVLNFFFIFYLFLHNIYSRFCSLLLLLLFVYNLGDKDISF